MEAFREAWQSRQRQLWCGGLIPLLLLTASLATAAQQLEGNQPPRLRELELEQLLNIEVSTVSRTKSTVGESAAAVSVITREDIRRSGATTIAELFRRVPGMDVARIDNSKWAISSRGFNDRYTDLLLVQVDGRTVYNPLFAGVYWDSVVYPLGDIERIEVIRGPGASVWGANAVNGIINIITRSAKDTQGGILDVGGGSTELGFGTVRYGAKLADKIWYRVYGEGFDRERRQFSTGAINDAWYVTDVGGRVDWEPTAENTLFFDWQYLHARTGDSTFYPQQAPPFSFLGVINEVTDAGHVLGRWTHAVDEDSRWQLQLYWDRFARDETVIREAWRWDTYDLDFQHNLPVGKRHHLTYGFGYRSVDASLPPSGIDNGFIFNWRTDHPQYNLFSAFVQDRVALVKDRLSLLIGTKLEHNDFTGLEVQPTGRLVWTPTARQSVWLGVSRALRTPAIFEDTVLYTFPPAATSPAVVYPRLFFNRGFKSEEVIAYEAGYRAEPTPQASVDLAVFYNDYRRLRIAVSGAPVPGPAGAFFIPLSLENRLEGETYGVEVAADWHPTPSWRLNGTYTFLDMRLHADPSLPREIIVASEANSKHSPQHQVYLQSSMNMGKRVELDLMGRYVSRLSGLNPDALPGAPDMVEAYFSLDARLAWRVLKNLELSVVGQNLLEGHHPEFVNSPQGQIIRNPQAEIRRSVYGRVKWEF